MKNELSGIGGLLTKRAILHPEEEAYVAGLGGFRLTFEELEQRCNRVAAVLVKAGVRHGDRVGLLLMNSVEFIEVFFAIAKLGAVAVPLNWRLVAAELEFIIGNSGAETLVFGEEFKEVVTELYQNDKTDLARWWQVSNEEGAAPPEFAESYTTLCAQVKSDFQPPKVADEDLLYIMYTSGTTGLPKGVVHTHGSSLWAVLTIVASSDLCVGDRYLSALPMFHVGALTPITACIYRGVTSVVMRSFDPQAAWQIIEKEKITTGLLVPAMLNFMIQVDDLSRFNYETVRWLQSGASPLSTNLIRQYLEVGIQIDQVYGLTESCGPACSISGRAAIEKIGSTGKAFFHTDVRVVNAKNEDCAPGEPGEVLVAGKHIMKEYWNNPEATAQTIVDGWLHTGDIATADEEGFIYVQDRIKDMVISGGENVYPAEIENILLAHPDIADIAVIGQPSERWGESPFAVVVSSNESLTEAEVINFCVDKLASFKRIKGAAFIPALPRNPSGKVLKRLLREQFPGPAPI